MPLIAASTPKNIILMIGDGMGFEHVKATGMYLNGSSGTLCFETFPQAGETTTTNATGAITDSAAAATAIATGEKVDNKVVSVALPGDGGDLQTILEYYRHHGKRTGLVTTTYMTHATPAGFGAHQESRNNLSDIASDYLNGSRPNILFGGGGNGLTVKSLESSGYKVTETLAQAQSITTDSPRAAGQFGSTHLPYEYDGGFGNLPHLDEMTEVALDILENSPNGFFLMIEGGRIDHAAHANDLERMIHETISFNDAAQTLVNWAQGRSDTLVIVTSDHETGGLTVTQNNGKDNYPTVSWSSIDHTAANVPVYATGVNAEQFSGTFQNTGFFTKMTSWDIADHQGALTFLSNTQTIGEPRGKLSLRVVRIDGLDGAVGVNYQTSDGTAVADGDYTSTSGNLTWEDGDGDDQIIEIEINNDSLANEGDEFFTVTLSSPSGGATLGQAPTITVTIQDEYSVTVDTLNDGIGSDSDGDRTLRWAVANVETGRAIGFSVTGDLTLTSAITIDRSLTITGASPAAPRVKGGDANRIFIVNDSDSETSIPVTISDLTISNGSSDGAPVMDGYGGGIINTECLTIDSCRMTDNSAGSGGAVANQDYDGGEGGTLYIIDSEFDQNAATDRGGAVHHDGASLHIIRGLFRSNSVTDATGAGDGGGALALESTANQASITNSTLYGNTSSADGGAINNNGGGMEIKNCTIVNNSASRDGGGINIAGGTTNLVNSIIGDNSAINGPDIKGVVAEASFSMVENTNGVSFSSSSNMINGVDPQLGTPDDHGGETQTIKPNPASQALRMIPRGDPPYYNDSPETDQRRFRIETPIDDEDYLNRTCGAYWDAASPTPSRGFFGHVRDDSRHH